jgi:hypothetical protein
VSTCTWLTAMVTISIGFTQLCFFWRSLHTDWDNPSLVTHHVASHRLSSQRWQTGWQRAELLRLSLFLLSLVEVAKLSAAGRDVCLFSAKSLYRSILWQTQLHNPTNVVDFFKATTIFKHLLLPRACNCKRNPISNLQQSLIKWSTII